MSLETQKCEGKFFLGVSGLGKFSWQSKIQTQLIGVNSLMPKDHSSWGSTQLLCLYCAKIVKLAGGSLSNHFFHSPSCHQQHDKSANTVAG
jgi:hypothetical protein